ncbi:biopolymer transporter ExbD [Roseivivax sp. GX 12232]|uniref:ExbD/TolR family protein n=1 Tax=Roseivivax sp. GX 12232 TaxID=2900547 RepID=UPI001E2FEE3D|nr:biopolymer transporter ExbD [Roseivivax sp. GX 12232]MCE0504016.1 biopolymer transporter ExbD [Roseivivax sp. GX 12232]
MRLEPPLRRRTSENLVPMINVVFLLLIFFLMTARIAPPEPFEVTPPEVAEGAEAEGVLTLYLSGEGELAFREARGEAALAALEEARAEACPAPCAEGGPEVLLRADRGLPATRLAEVMGELGAIGLARVELVTAR